MKPSRKAIPSTARIEVESRPGKGTTFSVTLPVRQGVAAD
jgi:signal transduction histidine kinase